MSVKDTDPDLDLDQDLEISESQFEILRKIQSSYDPSGMDKYSTVQILPDTEDLPPLSEAIMEATEDDSDVFSKTPSSIQALPSKTATSPPSKISSLEKKEIASMLDKAISQYSTSLDSRVAELEKDLGKVMVFLGQFKTRIGDVQKQLRIEFKQALQQYSSQTRKELNKKLDFTALSELQTQISQLETNLRPGAPGPTAFLDETLFVSKNELDERLALIMDLVQEQVQLIDTKLKQSNKSAAALARARI